VLVTVMVFAACNEKATASTNPKSIASVPPRMM
jgi:hypothetical protein